MVKHLADLNLQNINQLLIIVRMSERAPSGHICRLNNRQAEPTSSQLDHGYKAGVQMWSSAADKFVTRL